MKYRLFALSILSLLLFGFISATFASGVRAATRSNKPSSLIAVICTVSSKADAGPGTLRNCLENANAGDSIQFSTSTFPADAPAKIELTTPLPGIALDNLTIDATDAGVILDGSQLTRGDGLVISAQGVSIRGLTITGFQQAGVVLLDGAQSVTIGGVDVDSAGNRIINNKEEGVLILGSTTVSNTVAGNRISGNLGSGIRIEGGAKQNRIGPQNIITRNGGPGIWIIGAQTDANHIFGNHIGVEPLSLSKNLGNGGAGVFISEGAQKNLVGGAVETERNVISGNTASGVAVSGTQSDNNRIAGNFIGTDTSGKEAIGNVHGIHIDEGSSFNKIGGKLPGERNLVGGNEFGVWIWGENTDSNLVIGNFIGIDITGKGPLPNAQDGIVVAKKASNNIIGGLTEDERNIISRNGDDGVVIQDPGTMFNRVLGNYIGTDVTGTADLGNKEAGVRIIDGPSQNEVGGPEPGASNLISGNDSHGIQFRNSVFIPTENLVRGNLIGTDKTGSKAIGNTLGIVIFDAQNNTIGGPNPADRNIISGNRWGVWIEGELSQDNHIVGNFIGTSLPGDAPLPNLSTGVVITAAASSNVIGGTAPGMGNIIAGNGRHGIMLAYSANGNRIKGNSIGLNVSEGCNLGNRGSGIIMWSGAHHNVVGGLEKGAPNVISCNGTPGDNSTGGGIWLTNANTSNNQIIGNFLGTDLSGNKPMGNTHYGVFIGFGASTNIVGGAEENARNIISGNGFYGVLLQEQDSTQNQILGNFVGINQAGDLPLPNGFSGIALLNGTQNNLIGGLNQGAGNIIAGNQAHGIELDNGANGNQIQGNYIGLYRDTDCSLGNGGSGISFAGGAYHNVIGGMESGSPNIIGCNLRAGVVLKDTGTIENEILGNYIGVDKTGKLSQANSWGIVLIFGASHNIIGHPDAKNVVSGNLFIGVSIETTETVSNVVQSNLIGTDSSGMEPLGNGEHGIGLFDGAQYNQIGVSNTIAFNGLAGVEIQGPDTLHNRITRNAIFDNGLQSIQWISGTFPGGANAQVEITNYSSLDNQVSGTACGGCLVEIYAHDSITPSGRIFLGSGLVNAQNEFSIQLNQKPTLPYLAATQISSDGSTSSFSASWTLPVSNPYFLPLVLNDGSAEFNIKHAAAQSLLTLPIHRLSELGSYLQEATQKSGINMSAGQPAHE